MVSAHGYNIQHHTGIYQKDNGKWTELLAYAAGNWIGPQTFRGNEAPEYYSGKLIVAAIYGCAAAGLVILRLINIIKNRRHEKVTVERGGSQLLVPILWTLMTSSNPISAISCNTNTGHVTSKLCGSGSRRYYNYDLVFKPYFLYFL